MMLTTRSVSIFPVAGSFTEVPIVRIHFVRDETDAGDRKKGIMSPSLFLKPTVHIEWNACSYFMTYLN